MTRAVLLRFDFCSLRIEEQLHQQGLKLNLPAYERQQLQVDADQLARLADRQLIPAGEKEKADKRLLKRIQPHLVDLV
jgi:hypothetical protein